MREEYENRKLLAADALRLQIVSASSFDMERVCKLILIVYLSS